jgi:hypothetical protein
MGNQLKLGGTSVIRSSQVTTNCRAMSKPAFGPFTATYNAHLDLFCRANGSAMAIRADDSFSPAPQIQGNTFVARDGPIGLEVDALTSCTTAACAVNYRDNVFIGFLNPSAGSLAVPLYVDPPIPNQVFSNTGGANDHNSTFWPGSAGNPCPDSGFFATNMLCTDPGLVGVSTFPETGYDNVAPVSGSSAVVGAGVTISGLSVDYTGATRPSPPSMGALEYVPAGTLLTVTVSPSSASVAVGGNTTFTAACSYSDGSSTPCTVSWTDTSNHSSVNTTTGIVTGTSVGTDTITATLNSIYGTATVTITPAPVSHFAQAILFRGPIK